MNTELSPVDLDITAEQMRLEWLRAEFGVWPPESHPPWAQLSELRRAKWRRAAMAAFRMFRALGLAKDATR